MLNNRQYLYIIVSDYPYGFGEPFLEDELKYISSFYKKIYFIIPEETGFDDKAFRYKMPSNGEVIRLSLRTKLFSKIIALRAWFSDSWIMERKFVKQVYKQKLILSDLKLMASYEEFGIKFSVAIENLIQQHGHEHEKICLYSYWFDNRTFGLAKFKKKFPRVRVITRAHRWDNFFYVNPNEYLPFRPWIIKFIDGVFPISEAGSAHLKTHLGGYFDEKIRTYRLGVDINLNVKNHLKCRNELKVVSISFVSKVKRIDRIIEALSQVQIGRIEWTHIGRVPENQSSLVNLANEKLSNLPGIKFNFQGEQSKQQVIRFLSEGNADVLICTSESEGIPVSMMEALALGIPIISLNVGGTSELVKSKYNGSLLNQEASIETIANTLEDWAMMGNDEYREYSRNAYSTYLKSYSAQSNYKLFYDDVLNV
jgi:colanic acid/amylovoran biosynthesis glycosyltransferase